MDLSDLITPSGIFSSLTPATKKQTLEELARLAAPQAKADPIELFNSLLQRERLGSTGLGRGIAIPHVHVRGLNKIICNFVRLSKPVDFDAPDNQPVDLIFLLLSPEFASGDHLKALARISRLVRDTATIDKLRAAKDARTLVSALIPAKTNHAA